MVTVPALSSTETDWAAAFDSHRARMLALAAVIVRNDEDAADIVQTAFENAYKHRAQFDRSLRLEPWLARITSNEALSFLRRRRLRATRPLRDDDASAGGASPTDRLAVEMALRRLDPRHRVVVALFYMHGYGVDEVGQILEIPRGTVASRLNHARTMLRDSLTDRRETEEHR